MCNVWCEWGMDYNLLFMVKALKRASKKCVMSSVRSESVYFKFSGVLYVIKYMCFVVCNKTYIYV